MKLIKLIHIVTLKNATYKQLKAYAIGGAVVGMFGMTAVYLFRQYNIKHTDYSLEAFKIFTSSKPLMDMVGPFRTGMVSLSSGVTVLTDNFAKMKVFVRGRKANGILHYEASKIDDKWTLTKLEFQFVDLAGGRVRLIKQTGQENIQKSIVESDVRNNADSDNVSKSVNNEPGDSVITK